MLEQVWQHGPLWVIWILQFLGIEIKALLNKKKGDTLTEVIRFVFGFSKRSGEQQSNGMRLRRASFYGFSAWFFGHIAFGW
ncbi:MAG: hypothetical protein QNK05_20965 [Myxococcota bacterium]|nr:hypothetical protein [Myxococcota bacterium]